LQKIVYFMGLFHLIITNNRATISLFCFQLFSKILNSGRLKIIQHCRDYRQKWRETFILFLS
jgi:hypothetical protein